MAQASDLAEVGLVGLGLMGRNLALNIAEHGYRVAVHDRDASVVEAFADDPHTPSTVTPASSAADLVARLARPRRIIVMVRAGEATDSVIEALCPHLDTGDLVIDCGNSHYPDTERRGRRLAGSGIHFIGCGVSGGEEGARHGPSLMPGGDAAGWPLARGLLRDIAARADDQPCCDWLGSGGAGHYVKMIHNGIEYGDMQLIAEAYDLMHRGLDLDHDRMAEVFEAWGQGRLDSYLVSITRDILAYRDEHGEPLLEQVLDAAGQKGTGKWTGVSSLEHGVPVSLITEAVYARCLSALTEVRARASQLLEGPPDPPDPNCGLIADPGSFVDDLEQALYAAKIVSYTQGFMLLTEASHTYGWGLDLAAVARLWRGGCIIRSRFLDDIAGAYETDPELDCLALAAPFTEALNACQPGWRRVVAAASLTGVPVPGFAGALGFFDGLRRARGPANLLQAQRDYFGGHSYERVDRPRGEFFHTDWTGRGGAAGSTVYNA